MTDPDPLDGVERLHRTASAFLSDEQVAVARAVALRSLARIEAEPVDQHPDGTADLHALMTFIRRACDTIDGLRSIKAVEGRVDQINALMDAAEADMAKVAP